MLKKHQELLEQLQKTEALAVAIEKDGGNTQGLIHQLRSGIATVQVRVRAYKDAEKNAAEAPAAKEEVPPQKSSKEILAEKSDAELAEIAKEYKVKKPSNNRDELIGQILESGGYK